MPIPLFSVITTCYSYNPVPKERRGKKGKKKKGKTWSHHSRSLIRHPNCVPRIGQKGKKKRRGHEGKNQPSGEGEGGTPRSVPSRPYMNSPKRGGGRKTSPKKKKIMTRNCCSYHRSKPSPLLLAVRSTIVKRRK